MALVTESPILRRTTTAVKFQLSAATPAGSYPIMLTTTSGTATGARTFTVHP